MPERPPPFEGPTPFLLTLADALIVRWRLVVALPLGTAVIVAAVSLIVPKTYTGSVRFSPAKTRSSSMPAALSALAGQFGVSLGGDNAESPGFYVQLLTSRPVLDSVLAGRYATTSGDSVPLLGYLKVKGETSLARYGWGRNVLTSRMAVSADNQTGVVTLDVTLRDRDVAAAVANRFLEALNDVNRQHTRAVAAARRAFAEEQLRDAGDDLRAAEDTLYGFLQRNRTYTTDPLLVSQYERLQRRVTIQLENYTSLTRAMNEARLQEANTVPDLMVLEPAVPAWHRAFPARTRMTVFGFVLALTLAVALALFLRRWDRVQVEYSAAYGQVRAGVARLLRRQASATSDS